MDVSKFGSKFGMSCKAGCWILAGGAGLIAFLLLLALGAGGLLALLLGIVLFAGLGYYLPQKYCDDSRSANAAMTAMKTPGAVAGAPQSGGAPKPAAEPAAPAQAAPADDPAPAPARDPAADTASASGAGSPATTGAAAPASAPAAADAETGAKVKPSKPLAGQQELSERKGSWTYQGSAQPASRAAPKAAATPAEPAASADSDAATAASVDPDAPQDKPATLGGPLDGKADDLKQIKGVGPKLETLLNDMGFYHFDQIAGWSASEVNWVNHNLTGFKGRVTRDDWVAQAKILATGGETEFSKRVDKGGVY